MQTSRTPRWGRRFPERGASVHAAVNREPRARARMYPDRVRGCGAISLRWDRATGRYAESTEHGAYVTRAYPDD